MTAQQVKDLILTLWSRSGDNRISGEDLRTGATAIIDLMTSIASNIFPDWTNVQTFNTDGTGAGAYCKYADTSGRIRFWITLVDANINHPPPTNPLVTMDAFWIEGSPSGSSAVQEWAPGLYAAGLVVVYYDLAPDGEPDPGLYLLTEATRPFASANFGDELESGKWRRIGGKGTIENTLDSEVDDVRSVDTTESPISDLTIAANKMSADGQWIKSEIVMELSGTAPNKRIRAYVGADILIFDSGVIAGGAASIVVLEILVFRKNDALARCTCKISGVAVSPQYLQAAFISSVENHLKVTAQSSAGGIDGDITLRSSYHLWFNKATIEVFEDEFEEEFE